MKLFAHPLEFGNCNKVRIWNLTCNKFVHKYTWQTPKGESCEKPNLNVDGYCLELWRLICLVLVIGTTNMFKDGCNNFFGGNWKYTQQQSRKMR